MKKGKDLHVLFLKLPNSCGSVPHSLLWSAFEFFQAPVTVTNVEKTLLPGSAILSHNTRLHHSLALEVGIVAVHTISPLALTMTMDLNNI